MTLGVIRAVYNLICDDAIEFVGIDALHCTVCEKPVGSLHYGLCDDCYRLENPEYLDID